MYYDKTNSIECLSSSDLPIILGLIGGVIGVEIIVVVIVCCYRKRKYRQEYETTNDRITIVANSNSQIDEKLACPICDKPGCDFTLPCKHYYH